MSTHLDKIIFSTLHEAYKNYATTLGSINISGSIPNGNTQNFSTTLSYARLGTRADIYLDGNSVKVLANASTTLFSGGPYQYISSENADVFVEYTSSSQITVTISIFNGTGGPITLTTQTISVSFVQYDAPITAI